MSTRLVQLELDAVLCADLEQVAADLGLGALEDALRIAAAQWVARRKAELDDRDPNQRYFVNRSAGRIDQEKGLK